MRVNGEVVIKVTWPYKLGGQDSNHTSTTTAPARITPTRIFTPYRVYCRDTLREISGTGGNQHEVISFKLH